MPTDMSSPRRTTPALAFCATVLALLVIPAGAHAASARVIQLDSCGGNATCQRTQQGQPVDVVDVPAQPGEANKITIRPDGDNVLIRDEGAPLTAGEGCTAVDQQTVRCPLRQNAADQAVQVLQVGTGDGDDLVDVDGDLSGRAHLLGGPGADTLIGSDQPDLLEGGAGVDDIDGRGGNDTISYSGRKVPVTVDLKRGQATVAGETDKVANLEIVAGGTKNDTLIGSDSDDVLDGGNGVDRIDGGEGDDTLSGDGGGDIINGGNGDDQIEGDPVEVVDEGFAPTGSDDMNGGAGNDTITDGGAAKGDVMKGGGGNDTLRAGFGKTHLRGGAGRDTLSGSPKNDALEGGSGNDRLDGAAGKDRLTGGKGRDRVSGGRGADRIDVRDFEADTVRGLQSKDKVSGDRFDKFSR